MKRDHVKRSTLRALSRIDLLRALPPEEISFIAPSVERIEAEPGTRLISAGEAGDALYFIERGSVKVEQKAGAKAWRVEEGSAVGEEALLTGAPRSATVTAETRVVLWKVTKSHFDDLIAASPTLRSSLDDIVRARREGREIKSRHAGVWAATAFRAVEARYRGIHGWQALMYLGIAGWFALMIAEQRATLDRIPELLLAIVQLVIGLLIIQGACEALLHAVDRLGARLGWNGFLSGTIGSLLATTPEFVVIAFLVRVDSSAAIVTAMVTIFNNALAFSIYSFFLPKNRDGLFQMPRSLTRAGGELLVSGGAITFIVGLAMIIMKICGEREALGPMNLIVIGLILIGIYAYYVIQLLIYYAQGEDDADSHPPAPSALGHETGVAGIAGFFALGIFGAYAGGESVGAFAEVALNKLGMPPIPTAAVLAFFAGVSEYIIVYKSHRRGELGIALSNVFGGMTQVMFLLLPFGLLVTGFLGFATGGAQYVLPLSASMIFLWCLLFPLFYSLHQSVESGEAISNLDAAALTGIYLLLLYFLFTI